MANHWNAHYHNVQFDDIDSFLFFAIAFASTLLRLCFFLNDYCCVVYAVIHPIPSHRNVLLDAFDALSFDLVSTDGEKKQIRSKRKKNAIYCHDINSLAIICSIYERNHHSQNLVLAAAITWFRRYLHIFGWSKLWITWIKRQLDSSLFFLRPHENK